MSDQESDRSIVVGDGRADHKSALSRDGGSGVAKGSTRRQSDQSTHAEGKRVPQQSVSSSLIALREKASREPVYRFRGLYTMINLPMLRESFGMLRRDAACGVDKVSVADFESELEGNLADLLARLKSKRYRAKLVRRKYIPKDGGKRRPLGIPAVEDKIVQMAARRILEAIYEADFLDTSRGYRSGKGARQASQMLREELATKKVNWVVEADIKGFFNHLDHPKLLGMLRKRIDDEAFVRLIGKWLSVGVLEEDGQIVHPATGTPQGGIVSPVLANVYLHHVLDLRVENDVKRKARPDVVYMRYADDFVCGFHQEADAKRFLEWLGQQLGAYGLELAGEKSGIVKFTPFDVNGSGMFTFLGFDFYWARTRSGKRTVKRRTNAKTMNASLRGIKAWIRNNRSCPLKVLGESLRRKLLGYFNYYGVIGNSESLTNYRFLCQRIIFKWLNRRSQRLSYNWQGFNAMWQNWAMPFPRVVEGPYRPQTRLALSYAYA
jgi:RNA-directed DNA polymerase